MTLSCKQHLNVLRGGIEYRWEIVGRHIDCLDTKGAQDIKERNSDVELRCLL